MANFILADNQKVSYVVSALASNGFSGQLAAGNTVTVTSSDIASLTIVPDPTPAAGSLASGFLVAGNKLQNGVVVTATAFKPDGAIDMSTTSLIDIVAGTAVSLSISLGKPVLQ